MSLPLSAFIREELDAILDEWTVFASSLACRAPRDLETLRDHAEIILGVIANDLEQPQSSEQQSRKSRGHGPPALVPSAASLHGAARLFEGFSINEAMAEYRALRASVVRLWSQAEPSIGYGPALELTRFNEAVDQALTESLARYSRHQDRQARLFDAMLTASPDLHFIFDPDDRLVYASPSLASISGISVSALAGLSLAQVFPGAPPALALHFHEAARGVGMPRGALWLPAAPGVKRHFDYVLVPLKDSAGKVEAIAGTARDIGASEDATVPRDRSAAQAPSLRP